MLFGDQNVSPFCLPDQDLDLIKVKKKVCIPVSQKCAKGSRK